MSSSLVTTAESLRGDLPTHAVLWLADFFVAGDLSTPADVRALLVACDAAVKDHAPEEAYELLCRIRDLGRGFQIGTLSLD